MANRNSLTAKQLNERVQHHPDGSKEYWRDVPGFKWVRVSDHGRVKTLTRTIVRRNGSKYHVRGKILKTQMICNGYSASVSSKALNGMFYVGRLVLITFVGRCPTGMECCHWDGDPSNNLLSNLRWDTHVNNEKDKLRHGTDHTTINARGENHCRSKLTEEDVIEIRRAYKKGKHGYGLRQLARIYGMTTEGIRSVVNGTTWKHI